MQLISCAKRNNGCVISAGSPLPSADRVKAVALMFHPTRNTAIGCIYQPSGMHQEPRAQTQHTHSMPCRNTVQPALATLSKQRWGRVGSRVKPCGETTHTPQQARRLRVAIDEKCRLLQIGGIFAASGSHSEKVTEPVGPLACDC